MTNTTDLNMANAWIESQPAMVLSKNVEGDSSVLSLQFDSMMNFDENQDNIAMNLDGKFLQPGWSIKTEVSDFNQTEGEDGMSNIKADFFLAFNNLDDDSLSKRTKCILLTCGFQLKTKMQMVASIFLPLKKMKKCSV